MAFKKQTRINIHEKFDGCCAYCGLKVLVKDMQVDHIIPKSFFEHHIKNNWMVPVFLSHLTINDCNHNDNLFPTCRVCNNWKSACSLELFRTEISEQLNRLNKRSANYRIARKYGLIEEVAKPVVFHFEKN